jgi:O-acetyl-ADP-ribose deacetylase (regulator of RNase III)
MIPKSLHTITALVRVAQYMAKHEDAEQYARYVDPVRARVAHAAEVLGYPAGTADVHGLIDKAAAVIRKGAR